MKAIIVGIAGPEVSLDEIAMLKAHPPAGIILFSRNIRGPMALARLIGDLREALPPDALMMVDQEGGRVARLQPPDWRAQPSAGAIGALYDNDPAGAVRLAWLTGALIGCDCAEAGFDVVCAPVLDLRTPGATEAIGDRSYGADPAAVAALAHSMADGLLSAGRQPVGKHAPGHGKARTDSHLGLPMIGPDEDLAPDIRAFANCADLPWMMTAHIVYQGLDPDRPATLSPLVIDGVIRGAIGFDGVLVSDDLAMHALTGPPAERALAALAAGCDLALYCPGDAAGTMAVLKSAPEITDRSWARMQRARSLAERSRLHMDRAMLEQDQAALLP
jgi:beta-N-acetylhexosaminidase